MKRNEVLIQATIWRDLENIMLSEKKPIICCMIPYIYERSKTAKFIETEK